MQERKRDIVAIAYAGLGRMGRDHTGDVAFSLHGAVGVQTEQHHADAAEDKRQRGQQSGLGIAHAKVLDDGWQEEGNSVARRIEAEIDESAE